MVRGVDSLPKLGPALTVVSRTGVLGQGCGAGSLRRREVGEGGLMRPHSTGHWPLAAPTGPQRNATQCKAPWRWATLQ
jgi:hypothetical protein